MRAILALIIYCYVLVNKCEEAYAGRRIKRDPELIRSIQNVNIKSNATKKENDFFANYTNKLHNDESLQNVILNGKSLTVAVPTNLTTGLKKVKMSVSDRNATQSAYETTAGYTNRNKSNKTARINLKASVLENIPNFEREFLLDDKPSALDNVAAGIWLLDNNIDIKYPKNLNKKQNEFDNSNRGGALKKLPLLFHSDDKQQRLNDYKPYKSYNNINAYKEIITSDDDGMNVGFGDFDLMPPIVNRNNHRIINYHNSNSHKSQNRNLAAETAALSPINLLWHMIDQQQQQKRENNKNVDEFERNLQEIDEIPPSSSSLSHQQKADGGVDPTRKLANLIFNKILTSNDVMSHKREDVVSHHSKDHFNQRMPYNAYENSNNFDYIFDAIAGIGGDVSLKQRIDETPKHSDLVIANNKQTISGKDTIQTLNLLENALELVLSADDIVESNNKRTPQCPVHQHNNEHKTNETKSNICVQMDIDDEKNGNTIQLCTCHVLDK